MNISVVIVGLAGYEPFPAERQGYSVPILPVVCDQRTDKKSYKCRRRKACPFGDLCKKFFLLPC